MTVETSPHICRLENRTVIAVAGETRHDFLQGLVTNDVEKTAQEDAVYACLLSPQGKFLYDFFMIADTQNARLLLETAQDRAAGLMKALKIYAMRENVQITKAEDITDIYAIWGAKMPDGAGMFLYTDPRHENLGQRLMVGDKGLEGDINATYTDYEALRISLAVPDGARDMVPKLSTLLDHNIDLLNGVSWKKGCYVGQEVTARMHYRGLVKKRLLPIVTEDSADIGQEAGFKLTNADGRVVGELRGRSGNRALALLKLSALDQDIFLEETRVLVQCPEYIEKKR